MTSDKKRRKKSTKLLKTKQDQMTNIKKKMLVLYIKTFPYLKVLFRFYSECVPHFNKMHAVLLTCSTRLILRGTGV